MSKKPITHLKGRDARSGQFISVPAARQRPNTAVVERVPNPGYGDRARAKKNLDRTQSTGPRIKEK